MSYVLLGGWLGNQARGGRSVLRLESGCDQPIVWDAFGTRGLSSEPEEGFEFPCRRTLAVFCCRYHLERSTSSIVVQASHLIWMEHEQ